MDEEGLHPGRKSIRLKGHNYSPPALYFVTICTNDRKFLFGRVTGGRVELTDLGRIASESWVAIPSHFANVNLHTFVIMPNHVHGIIEMARQVVGPSQLNAAVNGAQRAAPLPAGPKRVVEKGSLSAIVRSYKSAVTLRARRELRWSAEIWQRNYFERCLREGREFANATRYTAENPLKWEWDRENPEAKRMTVETMPNGAQRAAPLRDDPWN